MHHAEVEQDLRLDRGPLHLRPDREPHHDAEQAEAGHRQDLGGELRAEGLRPWGPALPLAQHGLATL